MQSAPFIPIFLRSLLILHSHTRPCLPSGIFLSCVVTKMLYEFIIFTIRSTYPAYLIFLELITLMPVPVATRSEAYALIVWRWARWFESRLRHACLSSFCIDRGLCDGLITRPYESLNNKIKKPLVCEAAKVLSRTVEPRGKRTITLTVLGEEYELWRSSLSSYPSRQKGLSTKMNSVSIGFIMSKQGKANVAFE
jgi:hypothetical protein